MTYSTFVNIISIVLVIVGCVLSFLSNGTVKPSPLGLGYKVPCR